MSIARTAIKPIDSLRGVFALLIVWHHLAPNRGISYHCDFGSTVVLFFFVLSGYGIALSWKDRINENGAAKQFLIKRITKIFPIQWLTVLLFVIFGINIYSYWAVPFHLTLTQSAMVQWQINYTLNVPAWFLSSLFFCYLATPIVLKFAVNHGRRFVILQVCAIALWSLFLYVLPDTIGRRWLAYINPGARFLDYSIGLTLGLFWNEIEKCVVKMLQGGGKWLYTAMEMLFVASMFVFMICGALFKFDQYTVLRYPVIAGMIIIFSISKGYLSGVLQNKYLAWLGGISLSIYMLHIFVLHWTNITCIPVWTNTLVSYAAIILLSYLAERYLLRPCSGYLLKAANKMFNKV